MSATTEVSPTATLDTASTDGPADVIQVTVDVKPSPREPAVAPSDSVPDSSELDAPSSPSGAAAHAKAVADARAPAVKPAKSGLEDRRGGRNAASGSRERGPWQKKAEPKKEDFALAQQHWPSLGEVSTSTKAPVVALPKHPKPERKSPGDGIRSKSGGRKKTAWIPLEVSPQPAKSRGYDRRERSRGSKGFGNSRGGGQRRGRGGGYGGAGRRDRQHGPRGGREHQVMDPYYMAAPFYIPGAYGMPPGPAGPGMPGMPPPPMANPGLPIDPFLRAIAMQAEYYFSDMNLIRDFYLKQQMDREGWVPVDVIANFGKMKSIGADVPSILSSLSASFAVEISADAAALRKRGNWAEFVIPSDSVAYVPPTRAAAPAEGAKAELGGAPASSPADDANGGAKATDGGESVPAAEVEKAQVHDAEVYLTNRTIVGKSQKKNKLTHHVTIHVRVMVPYRALCEVLDELFPEESGVRLIAEPGRYFIASSSTLATCVYARRDVVLKDTPAEFADASDIQHLYYISDGVYGTFNCLVFDHASVLPKQVHPRDGPLCRSNVFGPTCDSFDLVAKGAALPKLEIGDWLYFENMGAYTVAAGSEFNGFKRPAIHYIDSTL